MSVAVVKLGIGNTASVMFALERLGAEAFLTDSPARVAEAERVILPGVGAAAYAMDVIRTRGLGGVLKTFSRPLLGICLGQQVLFEASDEGDAEGLARVPGRVTRMTPPQGEVLPHMGWSRVRRLKDNPLFEGVEDGAYFYFVHSYECPLGPHAIASAAYGAPFAAAIAQGNVYGCQFHPERSGAAGARLLSNFLGLPC
jgi:glutamine amidotransferase